MDNNNTTQTKKMFGQELDLVSIVKKMLQEKKMLCYFFIGFAFFGVFYSLNKPKLWTATVVVAPEIESGLGMAEGLSDIASMVGVNIGGGASMDAIYPDIYPDIFASTDFVLELMDVPVVMLEDTVVKTYKEHLEQDKKIALWSWPLIWIKQALASKDEEMDTKKINPFHLTKRQYELCEQIKGDIGCMIDKKTNVITISVTDEDPQVAAILADTLQSRLQQYITHYKTNKSRNDVEYYKSLLAQSKREYDKARQRYSSFADANMDVIVESMRAKINELENDMQLKYNTYSTINTQYQAAQARLQERTPAFTIIQSSSIPKKASSFPRSIQVILFGFLGIIFDAVWILYLRDWWAQRKKQK
jgi:hypothetical protein